jgi:hypothetical protein
MNESWLDHNQTIYRSISSFELPIQIDKKILKFVNFCKKNLNNTDILGEFGGKLFELLNNINYKHPEATIFIANLISNECIEEIYQIINLHKFCIKKGYKNFFDKFKFLTSKFKKENFPLNGKIINDPVTTNMHIRFIDKNLIWQCRNQKNKQIISNWRNIQPTNNETQNFDILICYHHNSEKTKDLKNELLQRRQSLIDMNCLQMVNELDEAIKKVSQEFIEKNYGFRRITLSSCANAYREIFGHEDDICIIPINQDVLLKSKEAKKFIDLCDNFSLFNNYPIFDHYGLIGSTKLKQYIMVGERDSQTFFVGYADYE